MKLFTHSTIGQFHTNHNEDALITAPLSENQHLLAVMDGCSMGTESHFASTLIRKVLKKITTQFSYRHFITKEQIPLDQLLKSILNHLFLDLLKIKNLLMMDQYELLSTLVLALLDTQNHEAEIIVIGDGLVCCNGKLYEFDQNDQPDYLGYHLTEDFEQWYILQQQILHLRGIRDFTLSTDGIFTFKKFDQNEYPNITDKEIIQYLLIDQLGKDHNLMLKQKLIHLEKQHGLKPSDDLSIVRMILDEENN